MQSIATLMLGLWKRCYASIANTFLLKKLKKKV